MSNPEARDLIDIIRAEVEAATDALLSAAERALRDLTAARQGNPQALDRIEAALCAIMEACAFQDITGQRLNRLAGALAPGASALSGSSPDGLLQGPASPGQGVSQSAADLIMSAAPAARAD